MLGLVPEGEENERGRSLGSFGSKYSTAGIGVEVAVVVGVVIVSNLCSILDSIPCICSTDEP